MQQPRLGLAEVRRQQLHPGHHTGGRGPQITGVALAASLGASAGL